MKLSLTWKTEDEGIAVFRQNGKEICRFFVYAMDEDTAELLLNPSAGLRKAEEETVCKVRECLLMLDSALKEEGFANCYFTVEERCPAAKIFHALVSDGAARKAYSEFMLKRFSKETEAGPKEAEKSEERKLSIQQSEDEILCTRTDQKGLFSCRLRPYRDGYYIYGVFVREDMRGRGIATDAMGELLARMDELPKAESGNLYLQVGSYNEPAVRLYRQFGFETETEFGYYRIEEKN